MNNSSSSGGCALGTPRPALALEMSGVAVASLQNTDEIVLEDINWSVAAGDYWAIGGLQGSGKSDFMAAAAGLMLPVHGVYRVFGHELKAGYEHEMLGVRLCIGLVFDGGRLLHQLSLWQNIVLPVQYHKNLSQGATSAHAEALLKLTGLEPWADRSPGSVRRPLQQRVGLARALALKPEVLLLDHPLRGLDARETQWWLDLLDQLAAGHPVMGGRPMTLVIASDDLRPWKERARQFGILKNRTFKLLGGRAELAASAEPLLQDLL